MAAAATATARRASSLVLAVALAVCSCGGGALGFVLPSAASMAAPAKGGAGGVKSHGTDITAVTTTPRPRAPFRLFSKKGGPAGPGGGGADIMDNLAGLGRELTTDEKIAALQKEVQAQAALAAESVKTEDEAEGGKEGAAQDAEMAIPEEEEEKEEEEKEGFGTGLFSNDYGFTPEPGFVDEGKQIKWPNTRRASQLTLLAVVAQIAFIVYIISLNSFLNSFPDYFQHFIDLIKSADLPTPRLPDL